MIQGLCFEQIIAVTALLIALMVSVGGLGGTFYVAYLSNVAIFIICLVFIFNIFFYQEDLLGKYLL